MGMAPASSAVRPYPHPDRRARVNDDTPHALPGGLSIATDPTCQMQVDEATDGAGIALKEIANVGVAGSRPAVVRRLRCPPAPGTRRLLEARE
jgi:hypothetical protein